MSWFMWEKCETLPMSFQLTIQLPPGQCWKVIQQTNTKPVCALLPQLQFNDLPLILCTIDSLCKYLPGWGFLSLLFPLPSCLQSFDWCIPLKLLDFVVYFWRHDASSDLVVHGWANICYMLMVLILFHLPSIPPTAVLHTVRRRRRWRSTGMSLHLVSNTSLPCSTKPCKVTISVFFQFQSCNCFVVTYMLYYSS